MAPGKEVSHHTSHGTRKCSATAQAPRYDAMQHTTHAVVHARSKGSGAPQDPVQEVFTALRRHCSLCRPSRPSVQRRLSSLSHSACALHAPSWKRDAGPRRPAARQVVKKSGAAIHSKRGFPAPAQLCCGHGVVLHVCAARKNTHEAPMSAGNATLKSTCGARRWQLPSTRCRAVERCGTRRRTRTVHNQPVGRT